MNTQAIQTSRKPVRESGIELLRIFMMLQVIFLHVCSKNMGMYTTVANDLGGSQLLLYQFFYFMSRCPVYVFIMISGYFSVTGNKTLSAIRPKIAKTYLPMLFYAIAIPYVGWACQLWTPSTTQMVRAFFPAVNRTWYFMTLYLLVLIFSPFLNRCLTNLTKREYTALVGILLFLFSIMTILVKVDGVDQVVGLSKIISTEGGKGLYGFLFMYILGGYLRLHVKPYNRAKLRFLFAFLVLGCINIALIYAVPGYKGAAGNNDNLFAVLQGVCLVLFFRDLKFKSRIINYIAGSCLGVYMIHEHPLVRKFIWGTLFPMTRKATFYSTWYFPLKILAIMCIIFVGCALIDQVRIYFFKGIDYLIARRKKPKGQHLQG